VTGPARRTDRVAPAGIHGDVPSTPRAQHPIVAARGDHDVPAAGAYGRVRAAIGEHVVTSARDQSRIPAPVEEIVASAADDRHTVAQRSKVIATVTADDCLVGAQRRDEVGATASAVHPGSGAPHDDRVSIDPSSRVTSRQIVVRAFPIGSVWGGRRAQVLGRSSPNRVSRVERTSAQRSAPTCAA
jgi:hypothetical protein